MCKGIPRCICPWSVQSCPPYPCIRPSLCRGVPPGLYRGVCSCICTGLYRAVRPCIPPGLHQGVPLCISPVPTPQSAQRNPPYIHPDLYRGVPPPHKYTQVCTVKFPPYTLVSTDNTPCNPGLSLPTFPEQAVGRADPLLQQLLAVIQRFDVVVLYDVHLLQQGDQAIVQHLGHGVLHILEMLAERVPGLRCALLDLWEEGSAGG